MLAGVRIGGRGRLLLERRDLVGPEGLVRRALLGDALDAVTDHRARVLVDGAFHDPLVVVDEEARGREHSARFLLDLVELQGAGDRVGGAAAQGTLVVDRRTAAAQVDLGWEWPEPRQRRRVELVALIR